MIDDEEKGSFDKERATTETSDKDLPTKTFQRRPSDEDLPTKTFRRRLREKTTTKMTKEKAGRQTKRFIDDHDNDDEEIQWQRQKRSGKGKMQQDHGRTPSLLTNRM